ncbi:argininosuccinate lyase [Abyssibacter profundi]|uniref:Argininosuccinate lyase n=1 Tax=Abyssibacter profundi TaxID=2182787 RepID=A0A363UQV5_9GAMM|nr:argininosuccinate lyase [Abyssibacter profundi]PWN57880.1 argininosuccinate lyase [Abyssibacter profundi]
MSSDKPWAGRFTQATDPRVEAFTESVSFDARLAPYDIQGSIAHATMLGRCEILTRDEVDAIVSGLQAIDQQIAAGEFEWDTALEDVHMNIERRLTEQVGDVGKKLHTARSRNDQVATDLRLFMRDTIDQTGAALDQLADTLLELAEREADTIFPGHTHMQVAQPVSFGHHMLAWREMILRDADRFADCRRRTNRMPLGAAALAGTPHPIDRSITCELLGFDQVCENSLDAVSDRDFAIEYSAAASLLMVHLSRMCEELVLWTSAAFGLVELPDAFCTGSSIMPQKKNPDIAELVRGKSGRVIGSLQALLVLMKGQPLAYNRDNQEDKEPLFDTVDTVLACLRVFTPMVGALEVRADRALAAAGQGFATATDLADYLVMHGVPFRDAHAVVGRCVRRATDAGCDLAELPLEDLQAESAAIKPDVYAVLTVEGSVAARDHIGGTAPNQVRAAINRARNAS